MESKSKVGTRAQRTPIIMHLYCLKMLPFFISFFSVQKKKWMDGWMDGCVRARVLACVRVCVFVRALYVCKCICTCMCLCVGEGGS